MNEQMNEQREQRLLEQKRQVRYLIQKAAHEAREWGMAPRTTAMALSWIQNEYLFEGGTVWPDRDGISFGFNVEGISGGLVFRADTYHCKNCSTGYADVLPSGVRVRGLNTGAPCDHEFVAAIDENGESVTFRATDDLIPPVLGTWTAHS